MGSRRTAVALSVISLFFAARARAEERSEGGGSPPPRAAFAYLATLPPAPPPPAAAPAREADEYPRRSWEAFPHAGVSSPFCRGDAYGTSRCADAGAGTAFGG